MAIRECYAWYAADQYKESEANRMRNFTWCISNGDEDFELSLLYEAVTRLRRLSRVMPVSLLWYIYSDETHNGQVTAAFYKVARRTVHLRPGGIKAGCWHRAGLAMPAYSMASGHFTIVPTPALSEYPLSPVIPVLNLFRRKLNVV